MSTPTFDSDDSDLDAELFLSPSRSEPPPVPLPAASNVTPQQYSERVKSLRTRQPSARLPLQLWMVVKQRDAVLEAAVKRCWCDGKLTRDLLPAVPPPLAGFDRVRMIQEERMRALGCGIRAITMHKLSHGAGLPAFDHAHTQKLMAAIMRRDAAVRAYSALFFFRFSSSRLHSARDAVVSPQRLSVTKTSPTNVHAWARSEHGIGPECGVVRWAVKHSCNGFCVGFAVGVASDAFRQYMHPRPDEAWFWCDQGHPCSSPHRPHYPLPNKFYTSYHPMPAAAAPPAARSSAFIAHVEVGAACAGQPNTWQVPLSGNGCADGEFTLELERAPGVSSVLRVSFLEKGTGARRVEELGGLPRLGMLYPILGFGCSPGSGSCSLVLPTHYH